MSVICFFFLYVLATVFLPWHGFIQWLVMGFGLSLIILGVTHMGISRRRD